MPTFQSSERKIYYTTNKRAANPPSKQQTISERLTRSEISILDKNNSAMKSKVVPLEGVLVDIQGQQCVTDKNGEFKFSSPDYNPDDAYIANFTY